MIAKRVPRKGSTGFAQLGAYLLNVKTGGDPASWTVRNAFVRAAGADGKVAWSRVSNCQSDDPGWAVKEILATQARNKRSQSDKNCHLVVSFPEGERPNRAQLADIEDTICAAVGFGEHQRISVLHRNTDNWHLHIAINKVHPRTFRNVEPWYDHYRLLRCCAELEVRLGLIRTNHTPGPERRRGGRAADLEAHQGRISFARWVREQARPALLKARDGGSWQELHQAAAGHGLEIKPHGAGLVIGCRGERRLHVRASRVDRLLSMHSLTASFGPFEAPAERALQLAAETDYDSATPKRAGALYESFCSERERVLKQRKSALAALRDRHRADADELRAWWRERFRLERARGLKGVFLADALQHLRNSEREVRHTRIAHETQERRDARARHPMPTWQDYLATAAAHGDEAALATLRCRVERRAASEAQVLEAENAAAVRHVIRRHLHPAIRRDGRVIYPLDDGGIVSDEARVVRVSRVTAGAICLALWLASERFGPRPLVVRGADDFRRRVAVLAGQTALAVSFADPALEARRALSAFERTQGLDRGADRGNILHR